MRTELETASLRRDGSRETRAAALVRSHALLPLVVVSLALFGCKSEPKVPPECIAARESTRQALSESDVETARQKLKEARELCPERVQYELGRLQTLLERKERQDREDEERRSLEQRLDREQPLRHFIRWMQSTVESRDKAQAHVECAPRESPEFGLCDSWSKDEDEKSRFVVRFSKHEPNAFRFSTQMPERLTCDDLGAHRVLSTTEKDGVTRYRCELTERPLTGLRALVEAAPNESHVWVYPTEYVTHDREFAKRLQ